MKGFNESFGYEIREGMDLNKIKFDKPKPDDKKGWIDVGGRAKWRKYAFPAFRLTAEEALTELNINQEIVIVSCFQTIVLMK